MGDAPSVRLLPAVPMQESIEAAISRFRAAGTEVGQKFKGTVPKLRRKQRQKLGQASSASADSSKPSPLWRQSWSTGDLALIDNMALAHLPTPGTQTPPTAADSDSEEPGGSVGLRLFHRTTMIDPTAVTKSSRGAKSLLL